MTLKNKASIKIFNERDACKQQQRDQLFRQATVAQSKQLISLKLKDLNKHLLLDKEKQR